MSTTLSGNQYAAACFRDGTLGRLAERMRQFVGAALCTIVIGGASAAIAAETIELKISHFLPERHGFQADFLAPWAKELEERTGGKVKVTIYPGTSSFGQAARQVDQVKAGVVDMALGLRGIPRGRFTRSAIIELPFLVEKAGPGTLALWELYKSGALGDEYDDLKVLALFTHSGGLIHTRDKPVRSLEDLKGLRLRSSTTVVSAMLEYLGASPVGLPPAQIFENLQKGVIDGVVTTWDLVGAIKVNEILKYHTDARAYTNAFYFVMNPEKFAALPADVQQAIDAISGDTLEAKFGAWWDKWDERGKKDAIERGNTIIEVSEETRDKWRQQLEPMIDKYLADLETEGVTDARAIYAQAQKLVAEFDAASKK